MKRILGAWSAAALATLMIAGMARAEEDWTQWRGPKRDGKSAETGLLKQWPEAGPASAWTIRGLGDGYSTVSLKGDKICTQGTQGDKSVVFGLNRADGKTLWTTPLGANLDQDQGRGPRGTPTIDGDLLYALSEDGSLACLKLADGSVVWKMNILEKFGGKNTVWHMSESPLVDGDMLIVTPGGPDATVVALNKKDGETIWKSKGLSDQAGYASCIVEDIEGIRTIMTFTGAAGVGVRAKDGLPMWSYRGAANGTANISTPVYHEGKAFFSSAYDTGCGLVALKRHGEVIDAEQIYFSREMKNHHGGMVFLDGHIYGFDDGILKCLKLDTGERVWQDRSVGKGSLVYADGMLFLLSEANVVGLCEATPKGYVEKGRFRIEDQGRPSWAHPVVCGGKLYIRNQGILSCYDVKAK